MSFESLPNRITAPLPEIYHAIPQAPPSVYDTQALISPLLHLADYLSPDARAKRAAAVAKANYEYRLYSGGGAEKLWYAKLGQMEQARRLNESNIAKNNAAAEALRSKGLIPPPSAQRLDAWKRLHPGVPFPTKHSEYQSPSSETTNIPDATFTEPDLPMREELP